MYQTGSSNPNIFESSRTQAATNMLAARCMCARRVSD